MAHTELESAFERWRAHGDAEAIADVYATVEPELARAARKLVATPSTADDLVQDTWVTALSKAAEFDVRQPLVPWLVGILAMCARRERRRAGRGLDVERLARDDEPSPERAVSNQEAVTLVATALERTPPLYREVLELHLVEGLSHAQIGEKLGRTSGSVRVQVFRGLARLRELLPAGAALSAVVAVVAPHSEAAGAARAFDAASRFAVPSKSATAAAVASGAGAGWLAKLLGVLAISAALVGGGTWLATRDDEGGAPQALTSTAALGAPGAGERSPADVAPLAQPARETASNVPNAPLSDTSALESGVRLLVDLVGADRALGGTLHVAATPADPRIAPIEADVAFQPSFELALDAWYQDGGARPRELFVVVDHPRYLRTRASVVVREDVAASPLAPGERREVRATVALEPAIAAVRVTPTRPSGATSGDRAVVGLYRLHTDGAPRSEPEDACAGPFGEAVRLRAREPGAYVVAVAADGLRPATQRIELHAGEEADLGEVATSPGATIDGRVELSNATAVAGALVEAVLQGAPPSRPLHGVPLTWIDGAFEHPLASARTGASGTFAFTGLAPRGWKLAAGSPSARSTTLGGSAEAAAAITTEAPASGVAIRLSSHLVVVQVRSGGEPLAGASVTRFLPDGHEAVKTDLEGRVRVVVGADAPRELRIEKLGYVARDLVLEPGRLSPLDVIEVELERGLEPCELVIDAGGDASWLAIELTPSGEVGAEHEERLRLLQPLDTKGTIRERLGADGTLPRKLAPGRYLALVRRAGGAQPEGTFGYLAAQSWIEFDLPAGGRVVHRVETLPGGRLRFLAPRYEGGAQELELVVRDARGATVDLGIASSLLRTDARRGRRVDRNKLFVGWSGLGETLAPGEYVIEALDRLGWRDERRVRIEAGRETLVEVGAP